MSTLTSLISAGGGGGAQVNQISQWAVGGETLYTDPQSQVWLKTGNILTSGFATYPDAYLNGGYLPNTSYDSVSLSVSSRTTNPTGVTFGNSGLKMYVASTGTSVVYQYNLSTAYDISTATYSTSYDFSPYLGANVWSISFNNTGTRCYVPATQDNYTVYQYDLSTAWNISTASVNNSYYSSADGIVTSYGVKFNSDGTKFYRKNNSIIGQYNASTPFSIVSATYVGNKSINNMNNTFYISSDGTYIIIQVSGALQKWNLSTPYTISTATYSGEASSSLSQETSSNNNRGGDFSEDLSKFIQVGVDNDTVYQYSIGQSIGIATATGDYDYLRIK
jgi:hypothetical protein